MSVTESSGNLFGIDAPRFWSTVMRSGEIGPGKAGGLRRLALTDADKEMRDLFITWCTEAGCTVTIDRVGNIFARRPGIDDHLPPVLMGSHLDTQFAGGKYDGIVGVLAGLEVLRTLDDRGVRTKRAARAGRAGPTRRARASRPRWWPRAPSRASSTWTGCSTCATTTASAFGAELERIGYQGKAAVGGRALDAYFELHIEQGPILDREAVPVGIVVGGYAARGMHVDVHGETAHSGPTPMDRRRNALVGAAMLAVAVNDVGVEVPRDRGQGHGRAPGGVAQQGGHPRRVRPAHLRRAPRRPRGGGSDVGRGQGRDARLRPPGQRGDAHRGGVAVRQRALRSRLHPPDPGGGPGARRAPSRHPEPGRARRLLRLPRSRPPR